jgi:hypothetical protein
VLLPRDLDYYSIAVLSTEGSRDFRFVSVTFESLFVNRLILAFFATSSYRTDNTNDDDDDDD